MVTMPSSAGGPTSSWGGAVKVDDVTIVSSVGNDPETGATVG
jgi:hypothetical protein